MIWTVNGRCHQGLTETCSSVLLLEPLSRSADSFHRKTAMIVDSHTHAWELWPYDPPVPDHEQRGKVENLLWEMDRVGVDQAVLVCARIDHNPGNNDYVADIVKKYPDRLIQFADVDCSWSDQYHTPGAADRLRQAAERYDLKGFTHYVKSDTDWFASEEGLAFFEVAAEMKLIASLAMGPHWQPALRELATRFPTIPFLCHHMAGCRADDPEKLKQIAESASVPNIHIKMSGFHYVSPNTDLLAWIIERAAQRRFADLMSEYLWQPMGAQSSGYITVDRLGAPRAAGGMCVTTRDLARVGQLLIEKGRRGDRQIVPEAWIDDLETGGDAEAWKVGDFVEDFPGRPIRYRSKWYVLDEGAPILFGLGIHGQYLFIDRLNEIVVAKHSCRGVPLDVGDERLVIQAVLALRDLLN